MSVASCCTAFSACMFGRSTQREESNMILKRTETLSRSSRRQVVSPRSGRSWCRHGILIVLAVVCIVQRLPTNIDVGTDSDDVDETTLKDETLILVAVASALKNQGSNNEESSVPTSRRTAATTPTSRFKPVDNSNALISRETTSKSPPLTMPNLDDAIVIAWNGLPAMDRWVDSIWGGNLVCQTIQQSRNQSLSKNLLLPPLMTHLNITFDCQQLFAESVTGTGNFLLALYMMRSTALALGNVHVTYTCQDARDTRTSLVLPWLTGSFTTTKTLTATIVNKHRSLPVDKPSSSSSSSSGSSSSATTTSHPQVPIQHEKPLNVRIMTKSMARRSQQQQKQLFAQACCPFWCTSVLPMRTMMEFELRRMALALVGVKGVHSDHPSRKWQVQQAADVLTLPTLHLTSTSATSTTLRPYLTTSSVPATRTESASAAEEADPLILNVELDDAVIHFRCGDLFSTKLKSYGFMSFAGYARHISSEARSIGILTQPFDILNPTRQSNQTLLQQDRKLDATVVQKQRCRTVTLALVKYLQVRHPHATVSIRNRQDETIALTYARIIMANQSVGAMSTFSVFPIVASFGTGYVLRPSKGTPNAWLTPFTKDETASQKIILFDETKLLLGSEANDLWESKGKDAVLDWFRT